MTCMDDRSRSRPASPASLLLALGERTLRQTLEEALRAEGYHVMSVSDGEMALTLARTQPWSLVLLDLTLPEQDGLEVCRQLRSEYATAYVPIVLLAKQYNEIEMIVGLEVGADEYMVVPVAWKVFRTRIRALLRRSRYTQRPFSVQAERQQKLVRDNERENDEEQVLIQGDLCIDLAGRTVTFRDHPVVLSARLFDLLASLASHPDSVLTRNELVKQMHLESEGGKRLLDSYIHWLREKLEVNQTQPQRIQTVRGVGYRFVSGGQEKTGQ